MSESLVQSHLGSCILVKNVPKKATADKIFIHFQKRINGGNGNVSSVTFPVSQSTPDQAIVEFEDMKTVAAVLQKLHRLLGHNLVVSKFNQFVLSTTDACISESLVSELSALNKFEDALETLKNTTGITVKKKNNEYRIRGQWHQVKAAAEQLEKLAKKIRCNQPESQRDKSSNFYQSTPGPMLKTHPELIQVNRNVYLLMKKLRVAELQTLRDAYHITEQDTPGKKISLMFELKKSGLHTSQSVQELISKVSKKVHSSELNCDVDVNSIQNVMSWFDLNCDEAIVAFDGKQKSFQFLAMSKNVSENSKNVFTALLSFKVIKTNVLCEFLFTDSNLKVRIMHGNIVNQRVDAVLDVISEISAMSNDIFSKAKIILAGGMQLNQRFQDTFRMRDPDYINRMIHIPAECGVLECKSIVQYVCGKETAKPDIKAIVLDILRYASNKENIKTVAISVSTFGENLSMDVQNEEIMSAVMCFIEESKSRNVSGVAEINLLHCEASKAQTLTEAFITEKMKWASKKKTSSEGEGTIRSDEEKEDGEDECAICLENLRQDQQKIKTLPCKHDFHKVCIDKAFKIAKRCPVCLCVHGKPEGNQPVDGSMDVRGEETSLPGYHDCKTIVITYSFRGGIQSKNHPNPGKPYHGTTRTAYLPDNREGRAVLILLRKAFEARITFTIGTSVTTGVHNSITWNDIHHKTSRHGGATGYGFPDPDYLRRVREELKAKGIADDN